LHEMISFRILFVSCRSWAPLWRPLTPATNTERGIAACVADLLEEEDPSDPRIPWNPLLREFVGHLGNEEMERLGLVFQNPVLRQACDPLASRSRFGDLISNQTALACHAVHHAHAGRQVYGVSPGLAALLRATELRGLTCDDLRLPFAHLVELGAELEPKLRGLLA
jgi:hypothetical protein